MRLERLNLGSGLRRNLIGYTNLTKERGWRWESGLPYSEGTIDCCTSSHTLMYVHLDYWPFIYKEVYRVMKIGGVWRITEDNMDAPQLRTVDGRITQTSPSISRQYLETAGFTVYDCKVDETHFTDSTILQNNYEGLCVPYWIEGVKDARTDKA